MFLQIKKVSNSRRFYTLVAMSDSIIAQKKPPLNLGLEEENCYEKDVGKITYITNIVRFKIFYM